MSFSSASKSVVVLLPLSLELSALEKPAVARGSAKSAAVCEECTTYVPDLACVLAVVVGAGVASRPLARRWNHVVVSVLGFSAVRVRVAGGFGLVGRGCPQFLFLHVAFKGSCICQRQCGQVQTGVALRTLRWVVEGVRAGSWPMGT